MQDVSSRRSRRSHHADRMTVSPRNGSTPPIERKMAVRCFHGIFYFCWSLPTAEKIWLETEPFHASKPTARLIGRKWSLRPFAATPPKSPPLPPVGPHRRPLPPPRRRPPP